MFPSCESAFRGGREHIAGEDDKSIISVVPPSLGDLVQQGGEFGDIDLFLLPINFNLLLERLVNVVEVCDTEGRRFRKSLETAPAFDPVRVIIPSETSLAGAVLDGQPYEHSTCRNTGKEGQTQIVVGYLAAQIRSKVDLRDGKITKSIPP